MAYGYGFLAVLRECGKEAGDRRVEFQLAPFDQLQDRGRRGQYLGQRRGVVDRILRCILGSRHERPLAVRVTISVALLLEPKDATGQFARADRLGDRGIQGGNFFGSERAKRRGNQAGGRG